MASKAATLVLIIGAIGLWVAPVFGAVLLVMGGIGVAIGFEAMVTGPPAVATATGPDRYEAPAEEIRLGLTG